MKPTIINVHVSGPTASGKTAVLAKIRKALEDEGFCCASPDLDAEARMMRPGDLEAAPRRQKTVVVLSEENCPRPPVMPEDQAQCRGG